MLTSHTLIAGQTGSGKSVLLNSIIYHQIAESPSRCRFIFIDLKKVELSAYQSLPHSVFYADNVQDAEKSLMYSEQIITERFKYMQRHGLKKYNGTPLYIVIDELADLLFTSKSALKRLSNIAMLGRAARVFLIACTQLPSRKTLPAQLTLNFPTKIALRCDSAIESRQIIGVPGAEELPQYGFGIVRTADGTHLRKINLIPDQDIKNRIKGWLN